MDKKKKTRSRSPEETPTDTRAQKRYRVDDTTPPPFNINNYQLIKKLGKGSFGKVMLASYTIKSQLVAVKIIKKKKKTDYHDIEMEATILRLGHTCPFLSRAYAIFQTESLVLFILEYARGGTLHKLIKRHRYLNSQEAQFYSAELVLGLKYLHKYGIIHRDLEPRNILLDEEGHVQIADFGFAQARKFDSKACHGTEGASGYMAPEVLEDVPYNSSADWWSFGVVVYEMATGKLPFSPNGTFQEQLDNITNTEPYYPETLTPEFRDFIQQLLKTKVEHRLGVYANAQDHPFFSSVNWETVKERSMVPPLKPRIKQIDMLSNIPFPENKIRKTGMNKEFTYIDPSWLDK
ncbi:protein kinase C delta type-like [Xenopus laevis]|uniref:Protein kinase C delta type-like n=1 Tax=Xenopus laevis TaxID=8355 RepID=A0A8J1MCM6_XENLA|nr:protein kinase C delta type-like [Xenopus laevis]